MQFIFYTKPDCPLCDRLKRLIGPHLDALRGRGPVELIERDIHDAAEWYEQYWDRIPVLTAGACVLLEGNPTEQAVADAFAAVRR